MTRKIKMFAGAAAAAAMLAAAPAAAQYGRYDPRYDPYHDDRRGDGFDIATGIAVVGTIAGILNAFRGGGRYGYAAPYGYGQPYGYARPYGPQSYGGYSYDYAYAVNAAVNSCGREAQRAGGGGRVEVRDVDQVSNGRFRVRGVFDDLRNHNGWSNRGWSNRRVDRDRFSCLVLGNGRIQDFDVK
jgi:hypothetical protein